MEEGTPQDTRAEGPRRWNVALCVEWTEPGRCPAAHMGLTSRLTAPKGVSQHPCHDR